MKLKQIATILAAASMATVAPLTTAAELEITVQNLTRGIYFTPLLVAAHTTDAQLFSVGEMASADLQAMAEGGDISGLEAIASSIAADSISNPAAGLLGPTASTTTMLSTDDSNTVLSIVAMMLPTNDGFVGLNSWSIPEEAGTYTVYLNAYDAGTEANDEVRGSGAPGEAGFPVPGPLDALLGSAGTGVTADSPNGYVHIHPGNLGDDDTTGGVSDISNTVQRWLNPVAMVTVTVSQ